jgi:3-oxoacyl-[acyl-carrier protein] reductase
MTNKKLCLITGASRGIGSGILKTLAEDYTVIGTATSDQGAERITQAIESYGATGEGRVLNLSDTESIAPFIKELTKDYGAVQVLVNNAGITADNLMLRMKAEEWDKVIQVNLSSVFHLSKACLRGMLKSQWGRIINISSVSGIMGNAGQCNYAAAKAGVIAMAKSLAKEVAGRNITVNNVAPGFINTEMTQNLPVDNDALLAQIPMGRFGEIDEISDAVKYLASDGASYVTGQTIEVNGGINMT